MTVRSLSGTLWQYTPPASFVQQHRDLPLLIEILLEKRGISPENIPAFLNPLLKDWLIDPSHLKEMDLAVARILQAMDQKEKIVIFGDYDVDGATSSALLVRFFQKLGHAVSYYIPHREKEGYGPTVQAFDLLKAQGADLIITVDCGTSAFEALTHATQIGLDVIVVDHHLGPATLPPAVAILNPNRQDETSPLTYVAAVGMSFLLAIALRRQLRQDGWFQRHGIEEPDLMDLLDLVALGTVADVMPLQKLNRALVRQGLSVMDNSQNLGIRALMDLGKVTAPLDSYALGFVLGPRINAAGRMDEAHLGTDLLVTQDPAEARRLAEILHTLNHQRQEAEASLMQEAQQLVQMEASHVMVHGKGWPLGLLGLVAGRLKEKHHKPTFALSLGEDGILKGSGRSISSVHMAHFIQEAVDQKILLSGGGHAMAGGVKLHQDQLQAFGDFLENTLEGVPLERTLEIDAMVSLHGLTQDVVEQLEALAPFGAGNPRPRFLIPKVRFRYKEVMALQHFRFLLESEGGKTLKGVCFRVMDRPLGEVLRALDQQFYDVVGTVQLNRWRDKVEPQFLLEDIIPCNQWAQ